MDAIEDVFFTFMSEKDYNKKRPRYLRIWKRLCIAMGDA